MNYKIFLLISYFGCGFIFCFVLLYILKDNVSTVQQIVDDNDRKTISTLMIDIDHDIDHKIIDDGYVNENILQFQRIEETLSLKLYDSVKVLCWIMHDSTGIDKREAIMETWGRRCNVILFVACNQSVPLEKSPYTTDISPNGQLVEFHMKDQYDTLWLKTKTTFKYIINTYKSQIDWIYKIDDDSYVVMENLRLFLMKKTQTDKHYYGCQYKTNAPKGYNSGGPGYVMSRYIAEKFVDTLSMPLCPQEDTGSEDVNIAKCLALIGVYPEDTRDSFGRFRFSPFIPEIVIDKKLLPKKYDWFFSFAAHTMNDGLECCSDSAIAYHYVTPSLMRTMEYLIYYLHPFSTRQ